MSNDKPMEFCEGQFHPAASDSNPSTSHTALGSPEFDYNNGPMGGLVRQKEVELRHVVPTPKPNRKFNLTFTSEDGLYLHFGSDDIGQVIEELKSLSELLESKQIRMNSK
mgnify:FL=1